MTSSQRKARLQTLFPVIAMNVAVLVGGLFWLYGEYDGKVALAQSTLTALSRGGAGIVGKAYDQAAKSLRLADVDGPRDGVQIITPQLRQGLSQAGAALDVSDRDYARILPSLSPGMIYTGAPLIDSVSGTPRWPLSLRTQDGGGRVRMLDSDDLLRPLEDARLKPDGMAWVIREDGTILASAPWRADMIGQNAAHLLTPDILTANPERVVPITLEGDDYLLSTAPIPGLPLRVAMSSPSEEYFIDWQREAWILGLLLVAMTATSWYAGQRQWSLLGQLDKANSQLRQEVRNQNAVLNAEIRGRQENQRLARILRNAVEYSGSMVLITDQRGLMEYANPAFLRATGYRLDDIIGHSPAILRHRELSPPPQGLWDTILNGRTWSGMFCNRRRDGSPLWVSATISPVSDETGTISHFVAVEEDATSRRDGEEQLREAKRLAEAASIAKSEFLSSMSHELRTPMNAILGFAQLLTNADDTALGERQRFYADSILKSGNHLLTLVNDILDMARIEAGRLSLSFERVVLDQVMAEILPMTNTAAERRKVSIIDEISNRQLPAVEADFTRLKQVLINLSSNAIKYNRTGGTVRFSASHGENGPIRIAVSDSGIGIPEKRRDEVFTPFARLGAEASAVEGTGIGLTITKMLVEAMGGQIGFFTQENLGTTFWVEIPRAVSKPTCLPAGPAGGDTPPQNVAKSLTVLYIEDNPSNQELMQEIIAQDPNGSYSLLTAATAEDGLALARTAKPDLVIMDINLPGISGIEAVTRMKADDELRSLPVVALSADVMPDTIRSGMKAGFLRYLRKPLDIAELRKILRQLADKTNQS